MTIEQDIKDEIAAIRAKADAEIAVLEANLAGGGSWLQQEEAALRADWEKVKAYFEHKYAAANPPPPPPSGA